MRRYDTTRHDTTRQDKTRQDKTRQDKTRQDKTRQDKTRQENTLKDKTRQDKTRQDKTRHDKTRQDKTRQDKTRQDNARHDTTRQDQATLFFGKYCKQVVQNSKWKREDTACAPACYSYEHGEMETEKTQMKKKLHIYTSRRSWQVMRSSENDRPLFWNFNDVVSLRQLAKLARTFLSKLFIKMKSFLHTHFGANNLVRR